MVHQLGSIIRTVAKIGGWTHVALINGSIQLILVDFAEELELENLELLVLIHANDAIVAIDWDQLARLADIVTVQHFDL